MVKIGVIGARGRMGRRIIKLAEQDSGLEAVLGLETAGHPDIGKVIDGVKITGNPEDLGACGCIIDFSLPVATLAALPYIIKLRKPVVIGTTGLDENGRKKIKEAAEEIPVVFSPNMSVGVNLLFKLVKEAAKTLKGYNARVEEAHHVHKKDSPSGTAKRIAEVINAQGFEIKFEDIEAVREGEIVGDHKITFESKVDKVVLAHYAKDRDIFAKGALAAAKWAADKGKGLYSMEDVLGL